MPGSQMTKVESKSWQTLEVQEMWLYSNSCMSAVSQGGWVPTQYQLVHFLGLYFGTCQGYQSQKERMSGCPNQKMATGWSFTTVTGAGPKCWPRWQGRVFQLRRVWPKRRIENDVVGFTINKIVFFSLRKQVIVWTNYMFMVKHLSTSNIFWCNLAENNKEREENMKTKQPGHNPAIQLIFSWFFGPFQIVE